MFLSIPGTSSWPDAPKLGAQCDRCRSWNIGWPCDLLSLTNSFSDPHITTVNPELDRGFLLGCAPGITAGAQLFLSWCVVSRTQSQTRIRLREAHGQIPQEARASNLPGNPDLGCVKGASRICVSLVVLDVLILRGHSLLHHGFPQVWGTQDAEDISSVGWSLEGCCRHRSWVGSIWEGFQGEKASDLAAT